MIDEEELIELEGVKFNKKDCVKQKLLVESKDIMLYSNLYPIIFTKDINIYEYSFSIEPDVYEENIILKIFREASKSLFEVYGYYYRSGPTFFALKEVKKRKSFNLDVINNGKLSYVLTVKESGHHSTIKKGQKHDFSEIDEKVIFLIIREILQANPNVHFDRDNLYLENRKKEIKGQHNYYIHDGYKISIQQADHGICLIVGVKNKIKGQFTAYDLLKENGVEYLIGRRFIPFEGSRHQQIEEIFLDKNPMNTEREYNGKYMTYYNYFKTVIGIEIKDKKQLLIKAKNPKSKINKSEESQNNPIKYYIPELCTMIGINDEDSADNKFMEKIIEKTRLDPEDKISQIEKCLELFYDTTEKKKIPCLDIVEVNKKKLENLNTIKEDECNTSNKKRLNYGIEIEKLNEPIKPYYLTQPTFNNGRNNKLTIKDISKVIPVGREEMSTDEWICLYTSQAENESFKLLNGFIKCAKGYGIKFKNDDSNWISMQSTNLKD